MRGGINSGVPKKAFRNLVFPGKSKWVPKRRPNFENMYKDSKINNAAFRNAGTPLHPGLK